MDSTKYHIGDEVYASSLKNFPFKVYGKIIAIEFSGLGVTYTIESLDGAEYRCYEPTETTLNTDGRYVIKGTYKFIENE